MRDSPPLFDEIKRECFRERVVVYRRPNTFEGNEKGKKAMGLDKQNNNFARTSRFFAHFAAVVARLLKQLNLYLPTFDELSEME